MQQETLDSTPGEGPRKRGGPIELHETNVAPKGWLLRLLDVDGVAVMLVAPDDGIVLANRTLHDALGTEEGGLLGRSLTLALGTDTALFGAIHRARRTDGRSPVRLTSAIRSPSGRERTFAWVAATVDDDGKVLCSGVEVTEQERTARAAIEKASFERLGEMAAVVAHQVRNPLASIAACAQTLIARLDLEASDRELVDRILERVDFLGGTINHLLEYASHREPCLAPVALLPLLRDTASVVEHHGDVQGKRIEVAGDDLVIQADAPQLKEVFSNLLINAAQAVGAGETVQVVAKDERGTARIEVRDHGPGIPPELQQRIFDPFFSTRHRGTGLGLAIVRHVVESHGGTVSVVHPEDGGTAMVVRLPGSASLSSA